MNSQEVFIHIHQGCFAATGAIVRLPQCQWSKPGGYGKISQCITTTKLSKAKTVCILLGIYGFVVLCFVVVMQSFVMNSQEVFIHIHQGCFAGTGAIVRLPQCQWSKPDGYGKISQCITTTKHSKAKTVCIFLGICYSLTLALSTSDRNFDYSVSNHCYFNKIYKSSAYWLTTLSVHGSRYSNQK